MALHLCKAHDVGETSGKRLVFRLFACYSHKSMEYGNHTAHAVWMDWQLRELIFRENALAHPPKVCMGVQVANVIAWMAARKVST